MFATYRNDTGFIEFLRKHELAHVRPLRVDFGDAESLAGLDASLRKFDACVYLAANGDPAYSVKAPAEDLRDNALAMVNMLAVMEIGHMVHFSSGAVYDGLQGDVSPASAVRPTLPYAISKWASERYVMHAHETGRVGLASVVRFFGAYGPYEPERKIYGRLVRAFAQDRNPRFTIRGNGENLIDAMYVDDTVRAILELLKRAHETRIIDLYSGAPLKLSELVREAASVFGFTAEISFIGEVPEFIEFRSVDRYMFDEFGFTPEVTLDDGLRRFRDWMAMQESEVVRTSLSVRHSG